MTPCWSELFRARASDRSRHCDPVKDRLSLPRRRGDIAAGRHRDQLSSCQLCASGVFDIRRSRPLFPRNHRQVRMPLKGSAAAGDTSRAAGSIFSTRDRSRIEQAARGRGPLTIIRVYIRTTGLRSHRHSDLGPPAEGCFIPIRSTVVAGAVTSGRMHSQAASVRKNPRAGPSSLQKRRGDVMKSHGPCDLDPDFEQVRNEISQ